MGYDQSFPLRNFAMHQPSLLLSAAVLVLTSMLSAGMQDETETKAPVAKVEIVPHPGSAAASPSRRQVTSGIQHGIHRDKIHRVDRVNKPTRNYDYSGFNYPRRQAYAYARPIRRFSSRYPSRNHTGYSGYRTHAYRSYRSYRSASHFRRGGYRRRY